MRYITIILLSIFSLISFAAEPIETADTIDTEILNEVVVTASRPKVEIIPAQMLNGEELKRLNSNNIADALRYFSGIQVKDYGGVGGIKTVNIRSMGTNHTGVVYDGVELGNAQNGQIDLGQFSLDNIEELSLYNGQKSEILQPAKDFGTAGSIYIRTRAPKFGPNERYHLRACMRTGSFDLINPSALVELKLSNKLSTSFSAEWINSSGKYKFRYRRMNPSGGLAYDTTAVRQNGDINATRIEANVNGVLDMGSWSFKVYNYNSERGIPGAIVNNVWRRGERVWDTNTFSQGKYTQTFGRFTTLNNLKYAFYRTHYVNNDDKQVKIDNLYKQQELYFSSANEFIIIPQVRVSAAYDFIWNTLNTDMYGFTRPDRFSNFLSFATSVNIWKLKFQGSMLGTFICDKQKGQKASRNRNVFTPAAFLSLNLNRHLSFRSFFKQSFRMPTFNDLYYADMGNSKLDPERVTQYNIGMLYNKTGQRLVSNIRFSIDAYYNKVHDKIVAYPKGQQFRWTMLNLGRVQIKGIDVSALITINPFKDFYATLRGQYTFQQAIDVTNPSDSYYRDQIPYIPRNSGSAIVNLTWRQWNLNYSYIYVGERYNQQENIKYNYSRPWYTSDISISRDINIKRVRLRALLEMNNLLSQDYDVILNYPMPKRNYRFTLAVEI